MTLPEGVERIGETRWPAPERYVHGGGQIIDFIYEDEFALLVPVRVSESLVGSSVEFRAEGFWLVCKEACIPGEGVATLLTSVSNEAGGSSDAARVIASSRATTPGSELSEIGATARWDGLTLAIDAPGALFTGADLHSATIAGANLFGARFEGAVLQNADLAGANLYGAELWKADTTGARLDGANLEGTKLA